MHWRASVVPIWLTENPIPSDRRFAARGIGKMSTTSPLLHGRPRSPRYCEARELRLDLWASGFDRDPPASYELHSIGALWRAGHKSDSEIAASSPAVANFYRAQNGLLEEFRDAANGLGFLSDDDHAFLAALDAGEHGALKRSASNFAQRARFVKRAVIGSNVCNIFLLFAQIYAFATSGSLAVLACFLDAVLDFISGMLILFTWSMKKHRDKHRYPVGRERLEPLGVMGMACLMTAATLLTLEESAATLLGGESEAHFVGISRAVVAVIVTALVTKLALYVYCSQYNDISVRALREDHRNDVISNSTTLVTLYFAQRFFWWLDPVGGIIISCLIIRNWVMHTLEHCDQLLGKAANQRMFNVITFMACNHSPEVRLVDTVRAYHVGHGIFAEVDIVLARDKPLYRAHDIGESLQVRIEQLEGVERCFVHLDTEGEHSPYIEHKEL